MSLTIPDAAATPIVRDVRATFGRLIRLATSSESPRPLVEAAWQELRSPLAVVDAGGVAVAAAPTNGGADAAIRLAMTCAAGPAHPPPGWMARRLHEEGRTVGWLALRRPPNHGDDDDAVVEALSGLLAAQLGRAALRRSVTAERQAAIRERMVCDPGADVAALLAEGAAVGVGFARVYWPSLIVWRQGEPCSTTLGEAARLWEVAAPEGSFVVLHDHTLALLYAYRTPGDLEQREVEQAVKGVVTILSRQRPPLDPQAILGEQCVPIERLGSHVGGLRQLRPYATRAIAGPAVVQARRFALDRLLEGVNPARAQSYVGQCVGALIAYDERNGSTLAATLELALEHPRRDDAARAAFMHRNTFRRRLQQAVELIDADLDDPDQRLALHVALKLHRHPARLAPRRTPRA